MPALADMLDRLDKGEVAQEFYILRGQFTGEWRVHYRKDGKFHVASAPKLVDAIGAALGAAPEPEDWMDLI